MTRAPEWRVMEPMDRPLMADQIILWLKSNHPDGWEVKINSLPRPMQRYLLEQIAARAIDLVERLFQQVEPIPDRQDKANEAGLTYFFTGQPCRHGHLAPRYAKCGHCVECILQKGRDYYDRTKEES